MAPSVPELTEGMNIEAHLLALADWASGLGLQGGLEAAVGLLEAFVCCNFTGPLSEEELSARTAAAGLTQKAHQESFRDILASDGEPAVRTVVHPGLLAGALAMLRRLPEGEPAVLLWRSRALFVQQRLLVNLAHSLRTAILADLDRLDRSPGLGQGEGVLAVPVGPELKLVRGLVHYFYREPHLSADALDEAKADSGVRATLRSELGVRTRHQSYETAQLVLRAASRYPIESLPRPDRSLPLPRVVTGEKLGSNVLDRPRSLAENVASGDVSEEQAARVAEERVQSQEKMARMIPEYDIKQPQAEGGVAAGEQREEVVEDTPLGDDEQALLLGECMNVSNRNPMNGLTDHETLPYLERLMVEPRQSWLLKAQTLLLRSRLESRRVRTVTRSLLQLAELAECFEVPQGLQDGDVPEPSMQHRARNFWRVLWPSAHALRRELCKRYMDSYMHKTALDIAESVHAWPLVFVCCARLGKRNYAESIIRSLMEKTPDDPWLWSSLGDATRPQLQLDPTAPAPGDLSVSEKAYKKAWELSGGKLTAAMRGLGELYIDQNRFGDAVECFDRCVQLNPMYGAKWFKHGWALFKTQNWERAAQCFTRTVQIDMEDAPAWSNLALCNLKMDRKMTAFHCLRQAHKYSKENWRVKDNLLSVAVDVKEYPEAVIVLNQILDLRGRDYPIRDTVFKELIEGIVNTVLQRPEQHSDPVPSADADDDSDGIPPEGESAGGVMPLCSDIEVPELLRAAGESAPKSQEEAERRARAARERSRMEAGKLIGRVLGLVTQNAELWRVAAYFHENTGSKLDAFDARLKEVGMVTKDRTWRQLRSKAADVLKRTAEMVQTALDVPSEALEARKVKTASPQVQAKMQAESVLQLAEDDFSATGEYIALAELVKKLRE
eukprot:Hpha_TRINITY_DN25950_c0_g1::TRINITY_DN25950_c0_g1_i1::g.185457::m.185457